MIRSILMVCIGNICRSPMAAGLLASRLADLDIRSAGLDALVGMPADPLARIAMSRRGVDIEGHRATQLDSGLCAGADIIMVMDAQQKRFIESTYHVTRGRVFRLGEFQNCEIFDPYGGAEADFERCLEFIAAGVDGWVNRITAMRMPLPRASRH